MVKLEGNSYSVTKRRMLASKAGLVVCILGTDLFVMCGCYSQSLRLISELKKDQPMTMPKSVSQCTDLHSQSYVVI